MDNADDSASLGTERETTVTLKSIKSMQQFSIEVAVQVNFSDDKANRLLHLKNEEEYSLVDILSEGLLDKAVQITYGPVLILLLEKKENSLLSTMIHLIKTSYS